MPNEFNDNLVKSIHSKLLLNDNIQTDTIDYVPFYQLILLGEFMRIFLLCDP